jgi:radical SAM superfamily enzyme YgiQ (UPF0313 family)
MSIKTITLINPPGIKAINSLGLNSPNPPIGLAYIAAVLNKSGYRYKVIDMAGEAIDQVSPYEESPGFFIQGLTIEEALTRIPEDTDILGISCMFGVQWPIIAELTKRIRINFPAILMLAGGEQVTALPKYSLLNSSLNAIVMGEGEKIFPVLINAARQGKSFSDINGIAFYDLITDSIIVNPREDRIKDLDSIPWPDWSSIPIENYIDADLQNGVNRGRSMPIISSRGCPFKCTFCSNSGMWNGKFKVRDPYDVVSEMKTYIDKYRVENFNFQDLTAFVDKKKVMILAQEIIRQKLNITWQLPSGTRIESFDDEVAKAVYESGCRNIAFAPESASPEILKSVKKQVNLDHMEKAIKIAVANKINLSCFIVVGFPLESTETLKLTLKYVRNLARLGITDIGVSQFVPYPGSELFSELQKSGIIELNNDYLLSTMNFYLKGNHSFARDLSPEEIYRWQLRLLVNFYFTSFLFFPIKTIKNILNALFFKKEETRYAKFITDVFYRRSRIFFSKNIKLGERS